MTHPAEMPVAVYRFYAPDGWLLYVGMTVNPEVRFAFHRHAAVWWKLAEPARTTVTWYDTRADAAAAETAAIDQEKPEWNIVGKDGYRGGRPRTVLDQAQEAAIAAVLESSDQARAAEEAAWLAVQSAREAGVPDTVLCGKTGINRATLNRKLGKRPGLAA